MPITTKDFSALTRDLQSIFEEVSATKVSDSVGLKIYNVSDTNRKYHEHLVLHGLAGIQDVTEGQDLPKVTGQQGDTIVWSQRRYGAIVAVTKDMRKFDLYNRIDNLVRSIVDDAWNKLEQDMADVLLFGWSASYTNVYGVTVSAVCPDGVALFSASHTTPVSARTFSNIITDLSGNTNPPLSREAIVAARRRAMTYRDPNGIIRPINLDTLLVPPSLADLAYRIVESEYLPGSANNDINPLKGAVKVIVWPHLETASNGTDTSAYWFMFDSQRIKETLHLLFAERPTLDAPEVVYENKDWEYSIDYYYTIGRGFPAYIYGSKGDNS